MKRTYFKWIAGFAALAITAQPLLARTWKSADGASSFEGDLRSYNESTGMVTVLKSGRPFSFSQDILSDADKDFLKEHAELNKAPEDITAELESTKVGKMVSNAKLVRLEKGRFKKAEMEAVPDYYILYFSASW